MALGYNYNKQVKPILGQPQQPVQQPIQQPSGYNPFKNPTANYTQRVQSGIQNTMQNDIAPTQPAPSNGGWMSSGLAPFKNYGAMIGEQVKTAMDGQQGSANPFARAGIANDLSQPAIGVPQQPATQQPQQPAQIPPTNQQTGLQDQGSITEAGKIYNQRVLDNLKNGNPLAGQAQAIGDRNIARRNYSTLKQTQENMAQSPFSAGSSQYQRAMVEGRAGANQANLAEQSGVNMFKRGLNEKAMEDAQGLEDTTRANAIGERSYGDQRTSKYSNLITDPTAKYHYNKLIANGMNPEQAFQEITSTSENGDGGVINSKYRGKDSKALKQMEADDYVSLTTDFKPESKEFIDASRAFIASRENTKQQPVSDADKARVISSIKEKQNLGEPLTAEEKDQMKSSGEWEKYTYETIPKGKDAVAEFVKNNPDGMFTIDGKEYEMVRGGEYIYDWDNGLFGAKAYKEQVTTIKDANGVEKYIYGGKINDKPPVSEGSPGLFSEW